MKLTKNATVICECDAEKSKTKRLGLQQRRCDKSMFTGDHQAKGDSLAASKHCRCGSETPDGFGVKVDLSSFFSDERCVCWVWVVARQPVQWLVTRLLQRLHLQRPACCLALLAPAGLLHPADPLALLCPGDVVRVIPVDTVLFNECGRISLPDEAEYHHECEQAINDDDDEIDAADAQTYCSIENECNKTVTNKCFPGSTEDKCCCVRNTKEKIDCCKRYNRAILASPDTRVAASMAEEAPLKTMKQRALELLNRYAVSIESVSPSRPRASPDRSRSPLRAEARAPPDAPEPEPEPTDVTAAASGAGGGGERGREGRVRRRRVRRRPRRPHSPAFTTDTSQIVSVLASASRDSSVVRNATPRPLAPRVVRALAAV